MKNAFLIIALLFTVTTLSAGTPPPGNRRNDNRHHDDRPAHRRERSGYEIPAVQVQIVIPEADEKPVFNAMLPVMLTMEDAPEYIATDFNIMMESAILQKKIRLHNFNAVKKVLHDSNLPKLNEMTPQIFKQIGKLLNVKNIIITAITRFEIIEKPYHIVESGAKGVKRIGFQEGYCRVISAETGEVIAAYPFRQEIELHKLPKNQTKNWLIDDYYRFMSQNTVNLLAGKLDTLPGLKDAPAL